MSVGHLSQLLANSKFDHGIPSCPSGKSMLTLLVQTSIALLRYPRVSTPTPMLHNALSPIARTRLVLIFRVDRLFVLVKVIERITKVGNLSFPALFPSSRTMSRVFVWNPIAFNCSLTQSCSQTHERCWGSWCWTRSPFCVVQTLWTQTPSCRSHCLPHSCPYVETLGVFFLLFRSFILARLWKRQKHQA